MEVQDGLAVMRQRSDPRPLGQNTVQAEGIQAWGGQG